MFIFCYLQRFRTVSLDGKTAKLHIWDTGSYTVLYSLFFVQPHLFSHAAGQERFKTITSAYYK